jgi:hypothetical protein
MRSKIYHSSLIATLLLFAGQSNADADVLIFPIVKVGDDFSGTFTIDPLVSPKPVVNGASPIWRPSAAFLFKLGPERFLARCQTSA